MSIDVTQFENPSSAYRNSTGPTMTNITAAEIISLKNPSFCAYIICSCILVIKMIVVALLTAYKRKVHKVYLSPEDAKFSKGEVDANDEVERVRRAHLNDLENIPIFWAAAFAYLFAHPPVALACFLYFTFTAVRIAHTVVYAVVVAPQPTRAILFMTGTVITLYMSIHAMIIGFVHI